MAKKKALSSKKAKVPGIEGERKLDYKELLNEEIVRHKLSGRFTEEDEKQIRAIEGKFGPQKALEEMDRIVLSKILADRSEKLQNFKDQRFDDVGLA